MSVEHPNIRLECLKPAERWTQPTGEEVREALRLAGLTGGGSRKAAGPRGQGRPHGKALDRGGFTHSLCGMGIALRLRWAGRNLEGLNARKGKFSR